VGLLLDDFCVDLVERVENSLSACEGHYYLETCFAYRNYLKRMLQLNFCVSVEKMGLLFEVKI
jgi:hypothetical protein